MAFDPNTYLSDKTSFDPDAYLADQSIRPTSSMGQIAQEAAKTAITGPYRATQAMLENPEAIRQQAPVAGAILGGPFGAGLGQIAKRMAGIAYGTESPSGTPMREALTPMIQTAVAGLPETPQGQAVTNIFKKGYAKAAETMSGLKKDITQTVFRKGVGAYRAPSLPKAQEIFGQALGPEGQKAMQQTASEAFDSELSKARQLATEIGTRIEQGESVTAIQALQARQATDRIISATSWKDKMARNALYGWRNQFDNELASQSGKLADASRTYRNAIVKDKLTTLTRMNKSGEPSALLPILAGSIGSVVGAETGNYGKGARTMGLGFAATSPALWGAGAAALGTISPEVRRAALAAFIDKFTTKLQQ